MFVPARPGYIVPHNPTQQILAGLSGGSAPQVINLTAELHSHAYMDSSQVWEGMQTRTLQYNVRNGNAQSGTLAPGR